MSRYSALFFLYSLHKKIDNLINVPLKEYKRIGIFFNIKIIIEVKTKHFSGLTVGYTLTTTLKLLEPTFGATQNLSKMQTRIYARAGKKKIVHALKALQYRFSYAPSKKLRASGTRVAVGISRNPGAAQGRVSRTRANPRPSDYVTHTHRTAHKQCDLILNTFFVLFQIIQFLGLVSLYILVYSRILQQFVICFNLVSLFDVQF